VPDGDHVFSATAWDGKGNQRPASVTVLVDNTAPTITITQPAPNALVSGTIPFVATASDAGSRLVSVRMLAGGQAPSIDGSKNYAPPVASDTLTSQEDTRRRPDGSLLLSACATDAAGNEARATVTVTTDNTLPDKSLVAPTEGAVVSGTIQITATAFDPHLLSIQLFADGVSLGTSGTSPFSVNYDTRTRIDGEMAVMVVVRDTAGNTSTCTVRVTVDNMSFRLTPRTLNLGSNGGDNSVTAHMEGVNISLLVPPENHGVALRVPGGNPVPVTAGNGGPPFKFDRVTLINAIRAGIDAGLIQRNSNVTVTMVATGGLVIGTDVIRIVGE
jgi:hypothetical protein